MKLGEFKVVCCQCKSDNVLEKYSRNRLDWVGGRIKYGEGIQRKCTECDNESFMIFRTWEEKSP